jgi:hypothetical protein
MKVLVIAVTREKQENKKNVDCRRFIEGSPMGFVIDHVWVEE